jgi:cation diffusion facilitator CzcD-associated flavoprotein CzcO
MGSIGEREVTEVECLVIGGGFGAVALLRQLLKNGFDARVYEKGSSFGGIWYWNCKILLNITPSETSLIIPNDS